MEQLGTVSPQTVPSWMQDPAWNILVLTLSVALLPCAQQWVARLGRRWRGRGSRSEDSADPQTRALQEEIRSVEERARELCRPETFVEYARIERQLEEKREALRVRLRVERQRAVGVSARALGVWARRAYLLLVLSLAGLWYAYGKRTVLAYPCWTMRHAPWPLRRLLGGRPAVTDGAMCTLRGSSWLWICSLAAFRMRAWCRPRTA